VAPEVAERVHFLAFWHQFVLFKESIIYDTFRHRHIDIHSSLQGFLLLQLNELVIVDTS